jgi:hypothetical protein
VRLRINTHAATRPFGALFTLYMFGTMGGPVGAMMKDPPPPNGPGTPRRILDDKWRLFGLLVAFVVVCHATDSTRNNDRRSSHEIWEPATRCRPQVCVWSINEGTGTCFVSVGCWPRTFQVRGNNLQSFAAASSVCPLASVKWVFCGREEGSINVSGFVQRKKGGPKNCPVVVTVTATQPPPQPPPTTMETEAVSSLS